MAALTRTLLVVCPEGPVLRVFTCVARVWGWAVGRTETLELSSAELQPEALAGALRPLALRWSVPPGTEVALVLPATTGGVLSLTGAALGRSRDRARYEMDLAGRIPFAVADIEYEVRPGGPGTSRPDQLAWLPRSIAHEFRSAFARLGLVLGEIVFRAQLFAEWDRESAGGVKLVVEEWADVCFFHVLAGGRVLRTTAAEVRSPGEFVDRLQLELLSLEASGRGVARVTLAAARAEFNAEFAAALKERGHGIGIERRASDMPAMFIRFWRSGETGIWLVPDDPPSLARVRRLTFAIAGLGALLAVAMAWHTNTIGEESSALESRAARLRPRYEALADKERQSVALATIADAAARVSTAPADQQAALFAVFSALPKSAWVTRFVYEDGRVIVVGRGIDGDSVLAKLKSQPGVARAADASSEETDAVAASAGLRFRLQFQWDTSASAPKGETEMRKAAQ